MGRPCVIIGQRTGYQSYNARLEQAVWRKPISSLGFCPGGAIAENCEIFANFFTPSLSSMPLFVDVSHHANGQRGGKACSRTKEVRTCDLKEI